MYALDIYGQIDKNYAEEFEKIKIHYHHILNMLDVWIPRKQLKL